MINIISSVVLLVISISQLNIFEIDGVFSSAHVRSIERHIEETQYTQNDLLVIQYSSTKYSEKAVADFEKLITNKNFVKAMWVGPYSIEIDYAITTGFDILGYVPGTKSNSDENLEKFSKTIINRFALPEIKDEVTRIARNPEIKFSKNERFEYPLRLGRIWKNIKKDLEPVR